MRQTNAEGSKDRRFIELCQRACANNVNKSQCGDCNFDLPNFPCKDAVCIPTKRQVSKFHNKKGLAYYQFKKEIRELKGGQSNV